MAENRTTSTKGYVPSSIAGNGYIPSQPQNTNIPTTPQQGYSPTSAGNNPTNPTPPGDD